MRGGKSITIIGGGLAGLTLGIGLRRYEVPVTLFEAGQYPRHRVCGEFISGRGQETLTRLGIDLMKHGARPATTAAFFAGKMRMVKITLPNPATCISRFILDDLLAREFLRLGGTLHASQRVDDRGLEAEGTVRAAGRRITPVKNGWRWIGLKVHATCVAMEADQEVHLNRNGYFGICRLKEEVNICGLFRSATTLPELGRHWKEYLGGESGSDLANRLAGAVFDEASFCSVAGLDVEPRRIRNGSPLCELGDALTMIPPVTGNGMSMAFEAAELAVQPLALYSGNILDWKTAVDQVGRNCTRQFESRLRWASRLHFTMFDIRGIACLRWALPKIPGLATTLFHLTR